MTEQEFNVAIIERLARIETTQHQGFKTLNEKIDKLTDTSDQHAQTISRHEAEIAVLKSKQGGWKIVLPIVTGLVAVSAFLVSILDRIYL